MTRLARRSISSGTETPFAAGISGYVVTDAFIDKIHKRIAENGADMIDAWMYKLCGDSTNEQDPADPGGDLPQVLRRGGSKTRRSVRRGTPGWTVRRAFRLYFRSGGVRERTSQEVVHADV